ncbi:MAG: hypothetical protein ACP5UO_02380 [Thermoplasmata archaeon]
MSERVQAFIVLIIITGAVGYLPLMSPSPLSGPGFPVMSVESISFGTSPFGQTENFFVHLGKMNVNRENGSVAIQSVASMRSFIGDRVNATYSFILPSEQVTLPSQSPGGRLALQPGRLLISSLNVSGSSSFPFITIEESVLSNASYALPQNSSTYYNLSLSYENSTFSLLVDREVYVNGTATNVSLTIENQGGNSTILLSFRLPSTSFSFSLQQFLTSNAEFTSRVLDYYQMQVLQEKSIATMDYLYSALIGASIFAAIVLSLYLYYRKK